MKQVQDDILLRFGMTFLEGSCNRLMGLIKCSHLEWFGNKPATPPGSVSADLCDFYKSIIPPG